MRTERYVGQPWHDKDNKITKYGLSAMRTLIIVGLILGLLLGSCVSIAIYETTTAKTTEIIDE